MTLIFMHCAHTSDREKNNKGLKRKVSMAVVFVSSFALGLLSGEMVYEQAVYARVARRILFGEE